MENDTLKTHVQENLLILLAFDESAAPLIISNVKSEMFDSVFYRTIAKKTIDFFIKFKTVCGETHLTDLLEKELKDEKNGELYQDIVKSMYENKDSIKRDYVLKDLNLFVKRQNLIVNVKDVAGLLQQGKIEEAESLLYNTESKRRRIELFDAGLQFIKDRKRTLSTTTIDESNLIYTGIPLLDKLQHVPTKKELYTVIGKSGDAKSWFGVHIGKMGVKQRKKVLHITLELSEERLKNRYLQAFFGIGSKEEDLQRINSIFNKDEFGSLSSLKFKKIPNVSLLTDSNITDLLEEKFSALKNPKLIIKEFPTGFLTIEMLIAFLENLEVYYNFSPDIIILDYYGLMNMDRDKYRIELGRLCIELRGIAVSRELALVNIAQANRAAEDVQWITRKHIAEDFSGIATSDCIIIPQSTSTEKRFGLRRILVDKGRNGKDGIRLLLSQNLSIGQYCLNSSEMKNNYFDMLKEIDKN